MDRIEKLLRISLTSPEGLERDSYLRELLQELLRHGYKCPPSMIFCSVKELWKAIRNRESEKIKKDFLTQITAIGFDNWMEKLREPIVMTSFYSVVPFWGACSWACQASRTLEQIGKRNEILMDTAEIILESVRGNEECVGILFDGICYLAIRNSSWDTHMQIDFCRKYYKDLGDNFLSPSIMQIFMGLGTPG